jgi:hypothetical protein
MLGTLHICFCFLFLVVVPANALQWHTLGRLDFDEDGPAEASVAVNTFQWRLSSDAATPPTLWRPVQLLHNLVRAYVFWFVPCEVRHGVAPAARQLSRWSAPIRRDPIEFGGKPGSAWSKHQERRERSFRTGGNGIPQTAAVGTDIIPASRFGTNPPRALVL